MSFQMQSTQKAFQIPTCFKSPLTFPEVIRCSVLLVLPKTRRSRWTVSSCVNTRLFAAITLNTVFCQASQMVWLETICTSGCNLTFFFSPHIFPTPTHSWVTHTYGSIFQNLTPWCSQTLQLDEESHSQNLLRVNGSTAAD